MTLPYESEDTCAVCGVVSEHTHLLSTNSYGAPDLDGRPPEMERSTIEWSIHRCPECGYCAPNIGQVIAGAAEVVNAQAYRQQLADSHMPYLAQSFLCCALVAEAQEGLVASRIAVANRLKAAWACDDARDAAAAADCRKQTAAAVRRIHQLDGRLFDRIFSGDEALLADLYRRSEQFGEADATAQVALVRAGTVLDRLVFELQLRLVAARDAGAHTFDEVTEHDDGAWEARGRKIIARGLAILAEHPDGLRYRAFEDRVQDADPSLHFQTVADFIWEVLKVHPNVAYDPTP